MKDMEWLEEVDVFLFERYGVSKKYIFAVGFVR